MITAIVQFDLPEPVTHEKAMSLFLESAPRYRETSGLIRKYYLLSNDGKASGGVYLFHSREDAEKLYTEEWQDYIEKKYGNRPTFEYFEVPVIVDNLSEEILTDKD